MASLIVIINCFGNYLFFFFFTHRTVKKSFIDCITGYFKKCGTPLHREVGMLFTDQIRSQLNQFCIDKKSEFLKSSKCLHENVFRTKQYKNDCNSIYLLSLKQAQTNDAQATDLICCGYRFWIKCTQQLAQSKCQAPGASSFMILTKYGFLGFPDLTCPTALFNSNSKKCKSVIPSKPSEGQKQIKINFGESGLSKYNVANMFSFIFH